MSKLYKYQTLILFSSLILLYAGGMGLFMYLKMLGFTEMEALSPDLRKLLVGYSLL